MRQDVSTLLKIYGHLIKGSMTGSMLAESMMRAYSISNPANLHYIQVAILNIKQVSLNSDHTLNLILES